MANGNGVTINKGDKVEINWRGQVITGKVEMADWYQEAGWYIGLTEANVPGGYSYWKQRDDGGTLVKVNGVAV